MALDPEAELRCIWQQWLLDAKRCYDQQEGTCGFDEFFVDEQNATSDHETSGRNSIMDAEALLCLLHPQTSIDAFSIRTARRARGIGVDHINELFRAHAEAGEPLANDGIKFIVEIAKNYLEFNRRSDNKTPRFDAGAYLEPVGSLTSTADDESPDTVDSLSVSLSVCLRLLYLMGPAGWRKYADPKMWDDCDEVYRLASERLTAALRGLIRCFAYSEYDIGTWEEKTLVKWPGSDHEDSEIIELRRRLGRLGYSVDDSQAFECGWSWAPHSKSRDDALAGHDENVAVYADPYPYLYCTLLALDGIDDLLEPWTESEELLDGTQLELAARLRNLSDLAKRYWAAIAFSPSKVEESRWALEEIPWRTADGNVSLQWTLYVYGIALYQNLAGHRARNPSELRRLIAVLEELAERARLIRIPVDSTLAPEVQCVLQKEGPGLLEEAVRDPALSLHWPGLRLKLADSNDDPIYELLIYDFAPQLLKRASILLASIADLEQRERLRTLIDSVWDQHLGRRANQTNPSVPKWWDFPERAYLEVSKRNAAIVSSRGGKQVVPSARVRSWYITQRVTEALVAFNYAIERRQRVRLTTFESFLREAIDDLANDVDVEIEGSGATDRQRLQDLKNATNSLRNQLEQGELTECLASLLKLVDSAKRGSTVESKW